MSRLENVNGYAAYARYQALAQFAQDEYKARRAANGKRAEDHVWADIMTACVRLSLTERRAFLPTEA